MGISGNPFISLSLFFFWLHCTACGILVPRPGIEPAPPALEAWSLNHWTAREVPGNPFTPGCGLALPLCVQVAMGSLGSCMDPQPQV